MQVTGWPVATIRRGEIVMRDGKVQAEPGSGQFLPRAPYEMIKPTGRVPNGSRCQRVSGLIPVPLNVNWRAERYAPSWSGVRDPLEERDRLGHRCT